MNLNNTLIYKGKFIQHLQNVSIIFLLHILSGDVELNDIIVNDLNLLIKRLFLLLRVQIINNFHYHLDYLFLLVF